MLKLSDEIFMEDFCKGWYEDVFFYRLDAPIGTEFIAIHKVDRHIEHIGYNMMIAENVMSGVFEDTNYVQANIEEIIQFPITIGTTTFYHKQQLIDFILSNQ